MASLPPNVPKNGASKTPAQRSDKNGRQKVPTKRADEGVASEAVVPAYVGVLVLWRQGNELGGVELFEERPQLVQGADKQDVGVHVDQRVHICQKCLRQKPHSGMIAQAGSLVLYCLQVQLSGIYIQKYIYKNAETFTMYFSPKQQTCFSALQH